MRKFGLIGYPLEHSFSKKYFASKFSSEKINECSYENFPLVTIDLLPGLIETQTDLEGLNVTIPYKSAVLRYLNEIDNEADRIGAVNVLKIKRKGDKFKLIGFNSDITGIRDSIRPLLGDEPLKALVLGTGGSSKAVCYVLGDLNISYTLVSRTRKPGCLTYSDIDRRIIRSNRLIINTTPLGMYPDVGSRPEIGYDHLDEKHILFDLIYNPERTTFLRLGEERGATILNGLRMLYRQAERSWEIWNDDAL